MRDRSRSRRCQFTRLGFDTQTKRVGAELICRAKTEDRRDEADSSGTVDGQQVGPAAVAFSKHRDHQVPHPRRCRYSSSSRGPSRGPAPRGVTFPLSPPPSRMPYQPFPCGTAVDRSVDHRATAGRTGPRRGSDPPRRRSQSGLRIITRLQFYVAPAGCGWGKTRRHHQNTRRSCRRRAVGCGM